MRIKTLLLVSALFSTCISLGQSHESYLRSLSVNATSTILLEWLQPIDATQASFTSYNVFHSDSFNGDYTMVEDITSFDRTDYVHLVPGSTLDPHYYFISTHLDNGDSIVSDTLTQVRMNVRTAYSGSTAWLTWNHMKEEPYLYDYQYEIHRKIGTGSDEIIATTDETEYYDNSFHNCDERTITYYVALSDPVSSYISLSTEDADFFRDITQPTMPIVRRVDVIDNSKVQITWDPSPESDVIGYWIYENRPEWGDIWNRLFFVVGTDTTFTGTNICDGEVNYVVSAADSCGNEYAPDYTFAHRIIDLQSIEADICNQTVDFVWTEYINMNPPLQGYNIVEVDIITGDTTHKATTQNTEFTLNEQFENGKEYYFYIEAFNDGSNTSTSCTQSITGYRPAFPDTLSITNISVVSPEYIDVEWYIDADANESTVYRLYREALPSGEQVLIRQASPSQGPEVFFIDETVDTDTERYRYFSEAIDTCGNTASLSPEAVSVLLQGETLAPGVYNLSWSAAENTSASLKEYILLRENDNGTDTIYRGMELAHRDQINDPVSSAGEVRYRVLAQFIDNNAAMHRCFSNQVALTAELKMLNFPNAFTPNSDGKNDFFGPVNFLNDQNVADYRLVIYDRWGKECFVSERYNDRWDGTCAGIEMPAGIYVFNAIIRTPQGMEFTRRGTVALMK